MDTEYKEHLQFGYLAPKNTSAKCFSQHSNYKVFRITFQRIQLVKYPTSHFPIEFRSKSDILHTFSLHEPLLRFDDFF